MKEQVASLLIVAALVVGVGIGYFGNTATPRTTTETVIKTHTTATTLQVRTSTITTTLQGETYTITITLQGESGVARCVVTEYTVWMYGQSQSGTTSYRIKTVGDSLQTYEITTSPEQTVGFATTTTAHYTGTLTGAIDRWNSTTCTFIQG